MTGRSRFIMLAACALQVLVVAGSIAWVAITGSGATAPVVAQSGESGEYEDSDSHDSTDSNDHAELEQDAPDNPGHSY